MKTILNYHIVLLLCLYSLIIFAQSLNAGLYKYQDENGVWHFTDTPPDIQEGEAQQIIKDTQTPSPSQNFGNDLHKQLSENVPPKNEIEKARNATVTIKTAFTEGSGFFISGDGYIVTNKHVVHGGEEDHEKAEVALKSQRKELDKLKKHLAIESEWLEAEEEWLSKAEAELEKLHDKSPTQSQAHYYNAKVSEFNYRLGFYASRKKDYDNLTFQYNQEEQEYQKYHQEFKERDFEVAYQRGCTIILADSTELNAWEVAVSAEHDLVLLKLEGYQTPFIKPGNAKRLVQGDTLYAIGTPMSMAHSVTSGIFSGFRENYIQTTAEVSPGNSGGPLITADGEVIGVNTKKLVHQYADGICFAIPIHIVFKEFNSLLGK